jgi:hypothetical protein
VAEEFEVKDGLLFYENRWVIPNDSALRLRILHENHDSKVAGHFGQFKTIERTKQNFFWNKMEDDVRDYVHSCDTCQRDKVSRHKRYGLLQPLDIPYRPWTSISMDFITALPESEGYTQIWVIVDPLTKMAHFIPLRTGEGPNEDRWSDREAGNAVDSTSRVRNHQPGKRAADRTMARHMESSPGEYP